ncbi:MAG: ribonuclease R [Pirellulaceae bacterium]
MNSDLPHENEEELFPEREQAAAARDGDGPPARDGDEVPEKASPAARKLEPVVLAHVLGPKYQPVKPRVIAKQLQLPTDQHQALKLAIRRLVKNGKLVYGAGHIVRPPKGGSAVHGRRESPAGSQGEAIGRLTPPARHDKSPGARQEELPGRDAGRLTPPAHREPAQASKNILTGTFRRTAAGFGFVRPQGATRGDKSGDIYIPARATLDAADRDVVRVRLSKNQARGRKGELRQAGEIVEIVERDTHQFVGVYKERQDTSFVDVDGKVFAQAIPVGDPGAKGAAENDKVVIEMVRFPTHQHPGEAVIVEVLGAKGAPGVDTLSIIREYGLPEAFPDDVLEDSRLQAEAFDESVGDRLDLTGETIVTIDPVDARDFDDAVSLIKLENGHWRLGVHIADVSHFVRARSPLDREARERGTSVYLPDRVIPMLPEVISNNLASLQPDKVRYTLSSIMEFTAEGVYVAGEVQRSAIKSCRRFAYEEVDEFLADRKAWREKLTPQVWKLLAHMHELAMTLRQRRLDGGSVELVLPEIKIDLDKRGEVVGAHLAQNTESHQMIEEFMLAANESVARLLSEKQLNFLRRVHEPPDPRKLKSLTTFVRELGIACDSLESRFEIKRVIAEVAGKPEEHAVNYAVLRSMQKAVYAPSDEGHFALNKQHYCHFTSPIRRYPDLTIHRMFEALARGKRPADELERMILLGEHCSDREQRAAAAERELVKVKLLMYLAGRIGEQLDGVITGVEEFGLFVQGVELPAEGLVHVDTLDDDHYRFDRDTHSLAGYRSGNKFRLGDLIRVEVAHVEVDKRELDFRVVKRLGSSHRGRPEARGTKKPQRGVEKSSPGGKRALDKQSLDKQSLDKQSLDERGKKHVPHGSARPKKKGRRG